MELKIFKDHEILSSNAADAILRVVSGKPNAVLCLASGDTPRLAYNLMAEKAHKEKVDLSGVTFIGLDEWMGIPPENEGSCHFFLQRNIFTPLKISSSQIYLFDGLSHDPEKQCAQIGKTIADKGGIDLMVVGVGMNGHIGFNEPGASPDLYAHVVPLDATTQSVGQKYFKEQTKLTHGITMGLKNLMESKKAILMASGEKKSEVMRKALEENISTAIPASIIRKHANSVVMLDEGAASKLKK